MKLRKGQKFIVSKSETKTIYQGKALSHEMDLVDLAFDDMYNCRIANFMPTLKENDTCSANYS
jgi:hypothetical protein